MIAKASSPVFSLCLIVCGRTALANIALRFSSAQRACGGTRGRRGRFILIVIVPFIPCSLPFLRLVSTRPFCLSLFFFAYYYPLLFFLFSSLLSLSFLITIATHRHPALCISVSVRNSLSCTSTRSPYLQSFYSSRGSILLFYLFLFFLPLLLFLAHLTSCTLSSILHCTLLINEEPLSRRLAASRYLATRPHSPHSAGPCNLARTFPLDHQVQSTFPYPPNYTRLFFAVFPPYQCWGDTRCFVSKKKIKQRQRTSGRQCQCGNHRTENGKGM